MKVFLFRLLLFSVLVLPGLTSCDRYSYGSRRFPRHFYVRQQDTEKPVLGAGAGAEGMSPKEAGKICTTRDILQEKALTSASRDTAFTQQPYSNLTTVIKHVKKATAPLVRTAHPNNGKTKETRAGFQGLLAVIATFAFIAILLITDGGALWALWITSLGISFALSIFFLAYSYKHDDTETKGARVAAGVAILVALLGIVFLNVF